MAKKAKEIIVKLKNVRLSYACLYEHEQFEGDSTGKYGANFILTEEANAAEIKEIKAAMKEVAQSKWPKGLPSTLQLCLRPGTDRETPEGNYAEGYGPGTHFFHATNRKRPITLDAGGDPVTQEDSENLDILQSGDYVHCSISLWAQDSHGQKRINAQLRGVRHYKEGERFGGGVPVDADDELGGFDDDGSASSGEDGGMFD